MISWREDHPILLPFVKRLIASGCAGLTDATLLHSFDMTKVRLQLDTRGQYSGFLNAYATIFKQEGVVGLYRGYTAVTSGLVPKMMIRFTSFSYYSEVLPESRFRALLAGLAAGVTEAMLVVTPIECCKVRLQQVDTKHKGGFFSAARQIGIRGLYKGWIPTATRQGSQSAIKFGVFSLWKERYGTDHLPTVLLGGAIANSIGAVINTPIDCIKSNYQSSANQGKSLVGVTRQIFSTFGYRGFFQGLMPRVLRIAPAGAIQFGVFTRVSRWIDERT